MAHNPIATDKQIAALKPTAKLCEVAVADCPGFFSGVRVSPKRAEKGARRASKTFYYRYRKPKDVSKDSEGPVPAPWLFGRKFLPLAE